MYFSSSFSGKLKELNPASNSKMFKNQCLKIYFFTAKTETKHAQEFSSKDQRWWGSSFLSIPSPKQHPTLSILEFLLNIKSASLQAYLGIIDSSCVSFVKTVASWVAFPLAPSATFYLDLCFIPPSPRIGLQLVNWIYLHLSSFYLHQALWPMDALFPQFAPHPCVPSLSQT